MTTPKKTRRRQSKPVPIVTSTIPDKPKVPGARHMMGYARVSMSDQNNQRQVDALVTYGVAAVDIYSDTGSGKSMDRNGWIELRKKLQPGDTLVVHSLERIGRNLEEMIKVERELREKGVTLKALAQDINTATAGGRLIFHILATVAQFEREWGLERTLHGLQMARERGVTGGRKALKTDEEVEAAVKKHGGSGKTGAFRKAALDLKYSKITVIRRWNAIIEQRKEAQAA